MENGTTETTRTDVHRRALSLSTRLVAICALLVAATLLVVAGVALRLTRTHLSDELDERLASVAASFQNGAAREGDADLAGRARRWLAGQPHAEDEVVAVRTATGEVLSTTGGLDLNRLPRREEILAASESRWWKLDGGYRVLSVPLMADGRPVGTLVAAASKDRLDTTVGDLVSAIAWASAIGLVFAVTLAFLAIRRTLRPLRRMAAEIDVIRPTGELPRHLPIDTPADEVGRLSEAFDRLLARIDDAILAQRRFVSDASHELRTPLTVAKGHLELVGDRGDPDARRSLRLAGEELDRVGRIVEDLLLLARLDEGLHLASVPVEVELLLREAALRGMLLGGGEVQVESAEGLYALGDPDRLLQVVSNLVANAISYGGDGVRVTLSAHQVAGRVVIEVADTGPGISADDQARLFERFYRGSRGRTPGGAGLGLAIVASLVRAMGGTVRVRSREGAGTVFSVVLLSARRSVRAPTFETART